MSIHNTIAALAILASVGACAGPVEQAADSTALGPTADQVWEQAALRFEPLPAAAPNPSNPVTQAKVELGKKLYYDNRLSKDGNISCNSCHNLATFGVDSKPTSEGDDGTFGDRNSPTVLNAAFHMTQFWDGRARDVEEQAGMPILNPVEMAIPSAEFLIDRLAATDDYPVLFAAAFPDESTPLSYINIQRALAAFERTLITPSRFDAYLAGDHDALTEQERAGLDGFMRLGCTTCHNGVGLGANSFQKFGLLQPYWEHTNSTRVDEGRFGVTGEEGDRYFFRVASLRNVAETAPYFHDGSVETLEEAIRVMVATQLGMELGDAEIEELAAFLRSLTGEIPRAALLSAG